MSCTDTLRHDRTIRRLLQGDPSEVEEGFRLLAHRYQKRTECWTARYFPSLGSQVEDIWQETMVAIWKIAQKRKLRADGSLRPLLKTIANRRAADRLRSRLRLEELEDLTQVVDGRVDSDRLVCQETLEIIAREVEGWTDKRREVWTVYLKYFAVLTSYEELRQAVFAQTGVPLTKQAVIRRIQVGREKIRELLRRLD